VDGARQYLTVEGGTKVGWKDYLALAIAALQTVLLPLVILIVILVILVLALGGHLASIAVFAEKSMS
jgi:hypothetical protein